MQSGLFTWIYYPQMKDQDQLYGLIEMEILLELECGLDVDFEPDWMPATQADYSKVRWQLSDQSDQKSLDGVLSKLEAQEPFYASDDTMACMRLLYGYYPWGADPGRSGWSGEDNEDWFNKGADRKMQHDDTTCESDLEEYETVQVTKHMSIRQKKSDQQNIREIIEKHPYKRWEEIEDNAPDSN